MVAGPPPGLKLLSGTGPVSHIRVPLGWTTRKHGADILYCASSSFLNRYADVSGSVQSAAIDDIEPYGLRRFWFALLGRGRGCKSRRCNEQKREQHSGKKATPCRSCLVIPHRNSHGKLPSLCFAVRRMTVYIIPAGSGRALFYKTMNGAREGGVPMRKPSPLLSTRFATCDHPGIGRRSRAYGRAGPFSERCRCFLAHQKRHRRTKKQPVPEWTPKRAAGLVTKERLVSKLGGELPVSYTSQLARSWIIPCAEPPSRRIRSASPRAQ